MTSTPLPAAGAATRIGSVRPKHPAAPVYLLDVHAVRGERTRADGALWDGVLNATPDDTNDAPSSVEALMDVVADAKPEQVRRAVEFALRYGTITRTLARACPLVIHLSIDGEPTALDVEAILSPVPEEGA